MKKWTLGLWLFLLASASFLPTGFAKPSKGDALAVTAAAGKFYSALNVMFTGNVEPMKAVWSHSNDVTYMGPGGGFQKGWKDVLASWEQQAALKLGGQVMPQDMRVTVGRDIAITHNYEIGENIDKVGNRQKLSIRATNVFRKEGGQWKMIGHHTDLLPYLEKKN